ncbi:MAG TPA: DUF4124 domain-containing protein [Steroidobacteraceae bacterium]|nr:DUF4124 domain-containing protein [Steroidobacteraceae bacterium]
MASCVQTARPLARRAVAGAAVLACVLAGVAPAMAASAIYKWIDADGITHLSSDRPPAGVKFERMVVGGSGGKSSSSSRPGTAAATKASNVRLASASPEQVARRNAVISELQNRECVVALEAIDRMGRSGKPVETTEFRRLQQTADLNCSRDPATRRQQEEQAARLRVSKGDVCVEARNTLADMLAPGRRPTRAQLKSQQEFIESHCTVPVR